MLDSNKMSSVCGVCFVITDYSQPSKVQRYCKIQKPKRNQVLMEHPMTTFAHMLNAPTRELLLERLFSTLGVLSEQ